jgi:hypothetical protein
VLTESVRCLESTGKFPHFFQWGFSECLAFNRRIHMCLNGPKDRFAWSFRKTCFQNDLPFSGVEHEAYLNFFVWWAVYWAVLPIHVTKLGFYTAVRTPNGLDQKNPISSFSSLRPGTLSGITLYGISVHNSMWALSQAKLPFWQTALFQTVFGDLCEVQDLIPKCGHIEL